jgi:hypothetical protein
MHRGQEPEAERLALGVRRTRHPRTPSPSMARVA